MIGHNAGFFGDGFGRENLHYDRWVCCGAYHCSQKSPNTSPADKGTDKRNAVCSHGAMVKKPCENLMFHHIYPSIDGETPDDNDPVRLLVASDICTLDIPSREEQQAMLATFDLYDGGGDWPSHTHGKVPWFKGDEALDSFFLKHFVDDEWLTPAEAISNTTPSGKTAVQEDSMYNNLVHIRYLKERAKLSSEEKASHALFFLAEHVADKATDLPEGCSLYIGHDSRYPMMDHPLFMTPRMLDIASRGRYHEVDATFLKGKEYKYVLHIVSYDETTGKLHTSFCMLTNKLDAAFHNHAFTRWLGLMKLHNPACIALPMAMAWSEGSTRVLHVCIAGTHAGSGCCAIAEPCIPVGVNNVSHCFHLLMWYCMHVNGYFLCCCPLVWPFLSRASK